MNIFNHLFNPKIKIMEKLQFYLTMYSFYMSFKTLEETKKANVIKELIDIEFPASLATRWQTVWYATNAKPKPEEKPVIPKEAVIPPAIPKDAVNKATAQAEIVKYDPNKIYDILPFYPCKIKTTDGKIFEVPKPPKAFTVANDEAAQKEVDGKFPTVDEFDMVMDEVWNLACAGVSAKELNVVLKKNLEGWYKELKSESDYYTKLSNPICSAVIMIKAAFGKNKKDPGVTVTRPDGYQKGGEIITLSIETDMTVKETPKPATPAATKDPKKDLKTVQTGKGAAVKAEDLDEEAQEAATDTEAATQTIDAGDDDNAPKVNSFKNFNDFENSIAEKYIDGEKQATIAKTDNEKKEIRNAKKEESRSLIQSWFDGKNWVENKEDGSWSVKLVAYHNLLLKEIQSNRASWPK
jgi:hypothetical protein